MKSFLFSAWLAVCLLVFASCVNSAKYGPIGGEHQGSYGYRDQHRADGRTVILVVIPAHSHEKIAHEYWNRRAIELCGGESFTKNIFRAERATQLYDYYGGRPGDYYLEGYLTCAPAAPDSPS